MTRQTLPVMASVALLSLLCLAFGGTLSRAQDPDTLRLQPGVRVSEDLPGVQGRFGIDLLSVEITTRKWQFWVDQPGGDQASVWKWTPSVYFVVRGPLAGDRQLFWHWFTPDGKGWMFSTFRTPALKGGDLLACETSPEGLEEFAISQTGVFPFEIGLTSQGQEDTVLFRGRAKIGRFHVGNDLPKFKDDFCYYFDQDWKLPVGYLYSPTVHVASSLEMISGLDESDLHFSCWFAQDEGSSQGLEGHLYCNGREVVILNPDGEPIRPSVDTRCFTWGSDGGPRDAYTSVDVCFSGVVGMAKEPASVEPPRYLLANHPGEYEIRLALKGQVVRTARFTVGQDGKIVDETGAWKERLGTPRMVLPVTVSGSADRAWNKEAWRAEAFWGNPLEGFAAP